MTMTSVNGSRQVKTWKGYCKNKGHTFWRYSSHQRTSNRHLDEKFSVVLSNLYVYHATPLLPHLAQMCLAEYTARLREVRQRQVLQLRIFQRPPFTLPQMILHTNSHRRLYIRSLHTQLSQSPTALVRTIIHVNSHRQLNHYQINSTVERTTSYITLCLLAKELNTLVNKDNSH